MQMTGIAWSVLELGFQLLMLSAVTEKLADG